MDLGGAGLLYDKANNVFLNETSKKFNTGST